jgi:hypothetical protein
VSIQAVSPESSFGGGAGAAVCAQAVPQLSATRPKLVIAPQNDRLLIVFLFLLIAAYREADQQGPCQFWKMPKAPGPRPDGYRTA